MKKFEMRNAFLVLASSLLLTGCVNDSRLAAAVKLEAEGNDPFTITTNLEEEKHIHTAQQATYLAYSGQYQTIPEGNYPDGQQHISDPNPVNLAWTNSNNKAVSRYDVVIGKDADLSDGYTVKGTSVVHL